MKDLYADKTTEAEGTYTDNRKTGIWKFYNPSGKWNRPGHSITEDPDGLWKWYYDNGAILREEEYFQGQRDGTFTEYSATGDVISQASIPMGRKMVTGNPKQAT